LTYKENYAKLFDFDYGCMCYSIKLLRQPR